MTASTHAAMGDRLFVDGTFPGFRRADGGVGVRNLIAVIPSVICANVVTERIAAQVPAFAGLSYGEVGDLGRGLPHEGVLAPRRPRLNGTPQWEPDPVMPTAQRPWAVRRGA